MIRRENHQTWLDKRERERKEDEKKQKRLDESPLFKETGGGVPKTVQLKLGAQVMLTKNLLLPMSGREHEALVNGSRGVVVNVVQTQEAMFHIQQELVRVRTRLYERERLDAALFKYSIAEVDMLEDTLRTLEKAAHQESFDYDYMHGDEDSDDDWIRNEAYYWRQDLLNEADRAFAEAREAEREADALEEEERARAQAWLEQMKKQRLSLFGWWQCYTYAAAFVVDPVAFAQILNCVESWSGVSQLNTSCSSRRCVYRCSSHAS